METTRIRNQKTNVEVMAIRIGMGLMEVFGMLMLLCGLFEIQLF